MAKAGKSAWCWSNSLSHPKPSPCLRPSVASPPGISTIRVSGAGPEGAMESMENTGGAFRSVELVIPPETIALFAAQRGQPAGHLHHTGFGRGSGGGNGKHGKHRRRLLFERQMMQDVGEGFAVHQAMQI